MRRWAGIVLVAWMVLGAPLAAQALPGQGLPDFIALVKRHGAAVVNISTTQAPRTPGVQGNAPLHPLGNWLRRFLQEPEREPGFSLESRSLGSGFIISADGYLLTNAHVIEDADEIIVRLVDRREFRARVVGVDRPSDVALIHIDATDLPVVRIGKPERVQVGEWVLAIGSPFGFEHSVTAGIISALGRTLPDESFVPFIQTDVAINPGNSGGPLFNLQGEVIGINSQIYSQTGGFMGLSFAIPIDVALAVQERLRAGKMVERGRIGVVVQEVTRALADSFGLPGTHGALIAMVEDGSPAERGGLRQGDAIVRFAGKAVEASNDLPRIVRPMRLVRRSRCRCIAKVCRTTPRSRSASGRARKRHRARPKPRPARRPRGSTSRCVNPMPSSRACRVPAYWWCVSAVPRWPPTCASETCCWHACAAASTSASTRSRISAGWSRVWLRTRSSPCWCAVPVSAAM